MKMFKILAMLFLIVFLSGCVSTTDFKRAKKQADQCEKAGLDYEISIQNGCTIYGIECKVE